MKFVTTEFTVELIDGNIISQKVNDDCINLTLEGVDETVEKINDLINSDSKPTKLLLYVASFYVKKEVMKHIVTSRFEAINFTALICPGYISKYVASIALKMYQRFHEKADDLSEIKLFIEEDKAIEWLKSM